MNELLLVFALGAAGGVVTWYLRRATKRRAAQRTIQRLHLLHEEPTTYTGMHDWRTLDDYEDGV